MFLIPILGILVLILIWYIAVFNRIVRLRNNVDQEWADIDVELRRRHNLVDNLVETVKGYASHERGTLDEVTAARSRAVALSGPPGTPGGDGQRLAAEGELVAALGRLFALAEKYPDLKANQNFLELHRSLEELEAAIESARQVYNDAVRRHNVLIEQFPNSIVAGFTGARRRDFFVAEAEDRDVPEARFG